MVLLSGDVVDRQNRFYESHAPLEQGLRELASNGISTVAVAGNHDFDVLRNLHQAIEIEQFHLLGTGGHWESIELTHHGETLRIDGWSFPSQHVETSPLATYSDEATDANYHIGVVHGDLDVVASRYAPLALANLQQHHRLLKPFYHPLLMHVILLAPHPLLQPMEFFRFMLERYLSL